MVTRVRSTRAISSEWTGWDSNPEPLACKASDLPIDLPARNFITSRLLAASYFTAGTILFKVLENRSDVMIFEDTDFSA